MRNLTEYILALQYLLQYCLLEMPRGINFSLRDLSEIIDSQRHGYAMTSKKAIRNIAQKINLHEKAFLDIGSGKGYVPYQAVKFGASIAEGIEFSKKFHSIAQTNYELLQVSNVCRSNCIMLKKTPVKAVTLQIREDRYYDRSLLWKRPLSKERYRECQKIIVSSGNSVGKVALAS